MFANLRYEQRSRKVIAEAKIRFIIEANIAMFVFENAKPKCQNSIDLS